jgi:hypothetical protein
VRRGRRGGSQVRLLEDGRQEGDALRLHSSGDRVTIPFSVWKTR